MPETLHLPLAFIFNGLAQRGEYDSVRRQVAIEDLINSDVPWMSHNLQQLRKKTIKKKKFVSEIFSCTDVGQSIEPQRDTKECKLSTMCSGPQKDADKNEARGESERLFQENEPSRSL